MNLFQASESWGNAKPVELKKEADVITTVGSLQIQYLLLRWCLCQKIIHLQRTIPPNLIGTYLKPGVFFLVYNSLITFNNKYTIYTVYILNYMVFM